MIAWHCDGPDCDTWARGDMRRDFLTVTAHLTFANDGAHLSSPSVEWHFCGWDCAMRYAATREPMEQS